MSIGIITDSTCDLNQKLIEKYNIEVIPLSVHFGEKEFKDGVDINPKSFFKKLNKNKELPHTSRPAPALFMKKYKKMLEKYDHLLSIHISAALSGTFESAKLAAREIEDQKITVIDSASISLGLGMLVILAAKLIEKDKDLNDIIKTIKSAKRNLYLYFTVKDLTYMEKGGRIGKASSFLGSIFSINPVISISTETGKVKPIAKVRGPHRAQDKIIKIIKEKIDNEKNNWLGFAHGDRKADLTETKNKLIEEVKKDKNLNLKIFNSRISATLGCHVGPTVYAVIVLSGDFLV
ncbi:EDD domain protein, DegV family [Halanaerobium congolense]|jgi:DegV family protein with EDD domain|uniref:DegV family protein with EDD domain n=1 Tax=Halanaerobium congolense TaxID=54121 RepID=A0A1G7H5D2_9FIRM|nr:MULTISPECIES: DegV family protein [Halanaerobium]KXS47613.1 MAG: degV family protein [Halanaerobium sp. T82-1]PTX17576.1 DegV family protein with EDD domain [Halanaerobium congolense]PUU87088.1 MAG: degV family protein [Halanaerobium sp.]PXV64030.1 DegV family protein with EDD domain [Halanaerobium congolense]TDS28933.1 DegV family protein with EDD domain [Halanaerobium congolense]